MRIVKKTIQMLLTAVALLGTQQALADCYVYVNICRPETGIGPGSFFQDYDRSLMTQNDPNRCAQRAREYLNYCAAPAGGIAVTYYYSTGAWKHAVVVTPTASQSYVTDFANSWIPVQKNY